MCALFHPNICFFLKIIRYKYFMHRIEHVKFQFVRTRQEITMTCRNFLSNYVYLFVWRACRVYLSFELILIIMLKWHEIIAGNCVDSYACALW